MQLGRRHAAIAGTIAVVACVGVVGGSGPVGNETASRFDRVCRLPWHVAPARGAAGDSVAPLVHAAATRLGGRLIALGNARRSARVIEPSDTLTLIPLDSGTPVGPPHARGRTPAMGVIGDTVYAVWGEPSPPDSAPAWWWRSVALWFSFVGPGGSWSAPRVLARGSGLDWAHRGQEHLVPATDGSLLLPFTIADSTGRQRLFVARLRGGRAEVVSAPAPSMPSYARAAVRSDTTFLVFVDVDTSRTRDQSSLFITRRTGVGGSWSPPALVQRGGAQGAAYPQLAFTGDGWLHVAWAQLETTVIRHVRSRDGGRTWSSPSDLHAPMGYPRMVTAVDDSAIAVFYDAWDLGGAPAFAVACWRGDTWSTPRVIGDSVHLSGAAVLDTAPFRVLGNVVRRPSLRFESVLAMPRRGDIRRP